MQAKSGVVILPHTEQSKMEKAPLDDVDKDALTDLFNSFGGGIVGEELDGAFRIAFGRSCEMIQELVANLAAQGFDLIVPTSTQSTTLALNLLPLQESPCSIDHELLSSFEWLPNKMGMYTFSKAKMQGKTLRQLFLQLEPSFVPCLLEDEPGTDKLYLHVAKKNDSRLKTMELPTLTASSHFYITGTVVCVLCAFMAFYAPLVWPEFFKAHGFKGYSYPAWFQF
jgi:hypothetical protein